MKTCVMFCAAEFDAPVCPIEKTDYILAADGGVRHTEKLGLIPHEILGDFDSLGYVPQGANVFPVEKDDTDSMLAVRRGLAQGCRKFLIYGALDGPRLDHTVANFQTLHFLAGQGGFGILVGKDCLAAVVKNGSLRFPAVEEGTVSVFCSGADARGVDIEGLYYELFDGTLSAGFPLGVSNHFTGKESCIRVRDGVLLVLWERKCGLPARVICNGVELM